MKGKSEKKYDGIADVILGNPALINLGYLFFTTVQLANIYATTHGFLPDWVAASVFFGLTFGQAAHAVGTMVYGPMHDR